MKTLLKFLSIVTLSILVLIGGFYYFGYDKYLPSSFKAEAASQTAAGYLQNNIAEPILDKIPDKLSNKLNILAADNEVSKHPYYGIQVDWSKVTIDKVEVYKSLRRLDLLADDKIIKSYRIRLGFAPVGHKTQEGDGKTPEGKYVLDWRNPQSQFYKSMHISYPNAQDKAQAKARGVSAGGDIMVHGSAKKAVGSKGQKLYQYLPKGDWTLGCISVNNEDMDEIWQNVKNGTEIEIFP